MAEKPFNPEITNVIADKAPRVHDHHEKPRILDLNVVNPTTGKTETVDDKTLEVRRTFKDTQQAHSAYRRLKQQNVERNRKNQLIQKKLNNETPYSPKKLESMGQAWRSNRSTGFISIMCSRLQPPFRQIIEQSPSLTFSKYPVESIDSEHKTKTFRDEITKCIRGWSGFDDLVAQVVHENTVFGFCALSWDDLRDWKPEFCRQDYTFFSIESPQVADATPIWAKKRRYQIAELLPVLENESMSVLAGWHIKNLVKAINNATPAGRTLDSDDDARRYEDWQREGSYGASYENDAKYVELGEILVREPHGKISRYLFDDKSGDEICTQVDRYNRMSDAISLFAIEIGSGSLMSSRGAGRDLYNTHVAIDKAHNLIIDDVYLRGLITVKKGPNAKPNITPLTVHHPIAIVSEGYDVVPMNMPVDVDAFIKLHQFIANMSEVQLGTFLPASSVDASSGAAKTASEVNRVAAIENQLRQGILMRFARQFSQAVERMQRGICHPEHVKAAADLKMKLDLVRQTQREAIWASREIVDAFDRSNMEMPPFLVPFEIPEHLDEDAVGCCLAMLEKNLPPSDILLLAYSPASELLQDTTAQDNAILDVLIQRYMGNPNVNQDALMKLDWVKKMGQSVANEVILPKDHVEALAIEATRQQIIELQSIFAGENVPTSPRDDDKIHLDTMVQKLAPLVQSAPPGGLPPQLAPAFAQAMEHFNNHMQAAQGKGMPADQLAQYKQAYDEANKHFAQGQEMAPPPSDLQPAAVPGRATITGAGMRQIGQTYMEANPTQAGLIDTTATPPKPPTAA